VIQFSKFGTFYVTNFGTITLDATPDSTVWADPKL
jgi:hypothetical protein